MKPDDRMKLRVKVEGKENFDAICCVLRGLFRSNRQSNGQATTNKRFREGAEIEFGGASSLESFLDSVTAVLRKRVRDRITFERL